MKQLFAFAVAGLLSMGAWAQTNLIAGWDGGDDTSSPSNFGWTSSANRPLQPRDNNGGIRMMTTYSNYTLEDNSSYSYSATSDPSSVIFWIRYNSSGESFTYTFQGLEANTIYDFSALIGWHNNSNAPTFTVTLTDGTNTMSTMTKSISQKQRLYAISSTFKTPSTLTSETDVMIVFTCNQTGDCMEAISGLQLVKSSITNLDFAKSNALAALPASAGDGLFTLSQSAIEDYTTRINNATTEESVNNIKNEIEAWVAPATSGTWNIQNASAVYYLGIDEEKVVIAESPVAITFEKGTQGFYIKVGDKYINMKGSNTWTMSASDTPSTEWTFTLNDGKYTISGPNGLIGTDNVTPGSECYGDKGVGNNGTWIISEALSEEQIALAVAKNALQVALNGIPVPTANIGTGVFQYNSEAIAAISEKVSTAQGVLDNESATKDQVDAQTAIISALSLPDLNAPAADQLYNIVVATSGHAKENNPVIIYLGETGNNNPTGYAMNANMAANTNLQQAFKFTKVEGNNYKISAQLAEDEVFLTNGSLNGSAAGWKNAQIQATKDAEKAMAFKIEASDVEGAFYIYNTVTNSTIACQAGGNIYTEAGNAYFKAVKTQKPSISFNTTAAGWGTVMLPFAQALPTGVKAYTCAEVDETTLTLVEVGALEANKPYIIEGEWVATNLTGDAQGTALTVTEGLLTGVYAGTTVPVGSYVLLNEEKGVGFYEVVADKQPTATANRAYLTVPAAEVKEFFALGGGATAIRNIVKIQQGQTIYNLAGQRMNNVRKGVNIIGGKKVVIK